MNVRRGLIILVTSILGPLVASGPSLADVNQVRIRLETTDSDGHAISAVGLGNAFSVRAYVQDLRRPSAHGVFSSYLDMTYPTALVSPSGAIYHAAPFENGKRGTTHTAGLVDEVGAFGGLSPFGEDESLLFTLTFQADAIGNAIFASEPADSVGADVLIYGIDAVVPPEAVDFGYASLSIVPADCIANGTVSLAAPHCGCALEQAGVFEGSFLPADLDDNGAVEFSDFLVLSRNYGRTDASYAMGDIDCNGSVNFGDFLKLSENFGKRRAKLAAVPEPNSFLIGWFALLALVPLRRQSRLLNLM